MRSFVNAYWIIFILIIIGFALMSCPEPDGGNKSTANTESDNKDIYTATNYTTTISGTTYNLTIYHFPNRAAVGDDYELIISRTGSEKISIGKIISVSQGNLVYQPNANGSPCFEMGLSGGNIIHIIGTITFNDGTSELGPGSFTSPVKIENSTVKLFLDGSAIENGGTTTFSKTTGSYIVSIPSLSAGTESSPFSLISGYWVQGSITSNASGASVWYSFPVTIGETYRIWLDNSYQGSGNRSLDVIVSTQYGNGSWIFYGFHSGWYTPQQFTANQTGIAKVRVQPYNSGNTGTFGIAFTSNNNTRPVLETNLDTVEYTDIVWYLNGNIVAQGESRTSITLSRQTPGIYQITVFATLSGGIKNSGSHNFVIQ